jgi:hypothetical protein
MADMTDHVQPSMLTRSTTQSQYEADWGMNDLERLRPEIRRRIELRRAEVAEHLRGGGELWEWQQGRDLAAHGGVAIVRDGGIVKAWADWKS